MRRFFYQYTWIFILSVGIQSIAYGQSDPDLYEKSKLISRFITYITWPESVFNTNRNFVVGVAGSDAVVEEIRGNLERIRLKNRSIEVRQITSVSQIGIIPVLYITNSSSLLINPILDQTGNKPILLISESAGKARKGGTDVNFVKPTEKDNWRFEIVTDQVKNKNLIISKEIIEAAWREIPLIEQNTQIVYKTTEPKVITEKIYVGNKEAEEKLRELEAKNRRLREEQAKIVRETGLSPEMAAKFNERYQELMEIRNKDSIASIIVKAEIDAANAKVATKNAENAKLQEQQNTKDAQKNTQFAILGSIVLLLLSLTAIFFLNARRRKRIISELQTTKQELSHKASELNKQNDLLESAAVEMDQKNEELEGQNKKITDSIRYANTIQQAMLPGENRFKELFDDHLIIYEPKDIVSGDFYWLTKLEEKTLIAVVDCTGHGVPGAFMSTIGVDLLNEIVNKQKEHSPAQILELLHNGIFDRLRQSDTNNRDGMDVCFCLIRPANNNQFLVTFSGAKRPLYFMQDQELKRINGDSKYIGGIKKEKQDFQNYDLILKKGDVLYLTTDGYTDSPNPDRRKFGSMRFQEMLATHNDKPLHIQKEIFISELNEHRLDTPSRDDITLVGVRL